MDWPVRFPAEMSARTVSVRRYDPADAAELFGPLADERVWEHMTRGVPADAAALDEVIRSRLGLTVPAITQACTSRTRSPAGSGNRCEPGTA
jgi:hypothetical protein